MRLLTALALAGGCWAPALQAVSINRGAPVQVARPAARAPQLFAIPADRIAIAPASVQFHRAGTREFGGQQAADGNNRTQAWIKAPREGSYIDVHWHTAADVARVVILEHPVDFCKACAVPLPGGRRHTFDQTAGEVIEFSKPVPLSTIRIQVLQSQVVWWQLFEIIIWTTKPLEPSEGRRNLHEQGQAGADQAVHHGMTQMQVVCLPDCKHGRCRPSAAVPKQRGVGGNVQAGLCQCEDDWVGGDCGTPLCSKCVHGQCVAPGECRCDGSWSGRECDMRGQITYGSKVVLAVQRKEVDLLFTSAGLQTPGKHQAVVATCLSRAGPGKQVGGEWWQIFGPSGTSDMFMHNMTIADGAHIRFRHVASGAWLRGDNLVRSKVRNDLREVSCTSNVDDGSGDWDVYIDRGADRQRVSKRTWGIGSTVVFVHSKSQQVLASTGQAYAAADAQFCAPGSSNVAEVHLQGHVKSSNAQEWCAVDSEASALTSKPIASKSVVRLISDDGACYLTSSGTGEMSCSRSTSGFELWILTAEPEKSGKVANHSNFKIGARVKIQHAFTRATIEIARLPNGKKTVILQPKELAPTGKKSRCLSVSNGPVYPQAHERKLDWLPTTPVALYFCDSRDGFTLTGKSSLWLAESVHQFHANVSASDLSAHLAELAMARHVFRIADKHFTDALQTFVPQPRGINSSDLTSEHLLHFKRAAVRTHLGHSTYAIQDLEHAQRLKPNFLEAVLYRSRIYITLGLWKQAIRGFTHIVHYESVKESLSYRAEQYLLMLQNVTSNLQRAQESLNVATAAYLGSSRCHVAADDARVLEWARTVFSDTLKVAPESLGVRLSRAEANVLLKDFGGAKADATWAIRLSGNDARGHFLRGQAHQYVFDDQLATEFFKWCYKIDPGHIGCRAALKSMKRIRQATADANHLFREGDFEGALEMYERSIDADPKHCLNKALMHLQRCRCLIYLDEPKSAMQECKLSFELDDQLIEADYLRKNANKIAGDYQRKLQEKIEQEITEMKREAAEKEKKRRAQEHAILNTTALSIRYVHDDQEWKVAGMPLCEQYFWWLNMTKSTNITTNDVKKAYRKMAMVWHPDKFKGEKSKERANSKFQKVVTAYEVLSNEKQLQQCKQADEPTKEYQQGKQQQAPREKPKPGRPDDEPDPQPTPVNTILSWSNHRSVKGMLSDSQSQRFNDDVHRAVHYDVSIRLMDRTDNSEVSIEGKHAFGSPDTMLHCAVYNPTDEDDPRAIYKVRDEFGHATAGTGKDAGDSKRYELKLKGGINVAFTAQLGDVHDEEKRNFNINYQEYDLTELVAMPDGATGIADLMYRLDDREGPIYLFLSVTRSVNPAGAPVLLLDAVTVAFTHGHWSKQMSLARKQKVATMSGLEPGHGSLLQHALDGDVSVFKSALPLKQGQALLVDLQMVYSINRIEVKEEAAHDCVMCSFEVSCDQRKWYPLHAFTPGLHESVDLNIAESARTHDYDYLTGENQTTPVLARFVRIIATGDQDVAAKYWGLQEFLVFGEQIPDSLAMEALVYLSDRLQSQADFPASHATDENAKSVFKSLGAGKRDDAIIVDLQDKFTLAMVELHQPSDVGCKECVIEMSADGKSWNEFLHMGNSGSNLVTFGRHEVVDAQYVRVRLLQPMQTVWEVTDIGVYGIQRTTMY